MPNEIDPDLPPPPTCPACGKSGHLGSVYCAFCNSEMKTVAPSESGVERLARFLGPSPFQRKAAAPASAGNVLAALLSLFIPGLGQLCQGRLLAAIACFVFSTILWGVSLGLLGFLGHIAAALEAASYGRR